MGSLAALVLTQHKSQVPRGSSVRYLQPVPSQQAAPPGCGSSKSLSPWLYYEVPPSQVLNLRGCRPVTCGSR